MRKKFLVLVLFLFFGFTGVGYNSLTVVSAFANNTATQQNSYIEATPVGIVKMPQKYLNKQVSFVGTFDKFTNLGLDYKPALKSSQDYIGFLLYRDDVTGHTIPLSELKLFLKRKEAEKYIELESGDKIKIAGKVFSTALNDAWVEVENITVIAKKNPNKKTSK